jgi:hypothetical protein
MHEYEATNELLTKFNGYLLLNMQIYEPLQSPMLCILDKTHSNNEFPLIPDVALIFFHCHFHIQRRSS